MDLQLQDLVERDLVEVGVEQLAAQGLPLELLEENLAAAPAEVEVEQGVLSPEALLRIAVISRGETATGTAALPVP